MTARPSFEMSGDARLLRQRLASAEVGEVVSYAELSTVISRPVHGSTGALQTAIRSLLRNERFVFANIRGVGFERLADADIVASAGADVDGIRRRARRSVSKITAVAKFDALPAATQLAHTTRLAVFTAIADMTTDRGMKRLEKAATGRATELAIVDTLKAFTDGR